MKAGVLHFSYARFRQFEKQLRSDGVFSVNLGDYMQTLAMRAMWRRLGVSDDEVIAVDRDGLAEYDGPEVLLPLNAVLYERSLPLPPAIRPVMVGVNAKKSVIDRHRDFFARHAPIGCRDTATAGHLNEIGIDAFVTGCLTLSFDPRGVGEHGDRIMAVFGEGSGRLPVGALTEIPVSMHDRVDLVYQRHPMTRMPLSPNDCEAMEALAAALLARYRRDAARVVTPLHHAATPCIASGIPVTICRQRWDDRFSQLIKIVPVHVAPDFQSIDWDAPAPDVNAIRQAQSQAFKASVERARGIDPLPRSRRLSLWRRRG